jgi:hypothetical protein
MMNVNNHTRISSSRNSNCSNSSCLYHGFATDNIAIVVTVILAGWAIRPEKTSLKQGAGGSNNLVVVGSSGSIVSNDSKLAKYFCDLYVCHSSNSRGRRPRVPAQPGDKTEEPGEEEEKKEKEETL